MTTTNQLRRSLSCVNWKHAPPPPDRSLAMLHARGKRRSLARPTKAFAPMYYRKRSIVNTAIRIDIGDDYVASNTVTSFFLIKMQIVSEQCFQNVKGPPFSRTTTIYAPCISASWKRMSIRQTFSRFSHKPLFTTAYEGVLLTQASFTKRALAP